MIEKVKISAEQEKALKDYRTYKPQADLNYSDLEYFIRYRHTFENVYKSLKDFTIEEFAKLLYVKDSYEVVTDLYTGDKVVRVGGHMFSNMSLINTINYITTDGRAWLKETGTHIRLSEIRRATADEIDRYFIKAGDWVRNRKGDVGIVERIEGVNVWAYWGENKYKNCERIDLTTKLTPKEVEEMQEKELWAQIGREVGEIKEGDLGSHINGSHTSSKQVLEHMYKRGTLDRLYPIEKSIKLGGNRND